MSRGYRRPCAGPFTGRCAGPFAGTCAAAVAAPCAARQSVLNPAGPVGQQTADIAWLLVVGAALVFAVVMAILALALWRRRRQLNPGPSTAVWLVGAGIVFPGLVLSALLWHVQARSPRLAVAPQPQELVVGVTGRMWWWELRYALPDGTTVALANELRLPAGRSVALALGSSDVIHSFWVPALAGKVDMLPGRVHPLRLRADVPGVWRGQCAEFCGAQHARMALDVVVLEAAQFDAWLTAQSRPARLRDDPQVRSGRGIYEEQRCAVCHRIRGLDESPVQSAPDLTHVASRLRLGAGVLATHREGFATWVADVQGLKTGARMPSFEHLDAAALAALAAFLDSLE